MASNTIEIRSAGELIELCAGYRDVAWNGRPVGWYVDRVRARGLERIVEGCASAEEAMAAARYVVAR